MNGNKGELKINSFTRFLFSLITLFIILGALPVGVYLVGQKTAFLPEAGVKVPEPVGETSFTVDHDQKMSSGGKIAVNILARSDNDTANLFAVRLIYPQDSLEVSSIATSSASLPAGISLDQDVKTNFLADKWLESSAENGQVTLIGGVANPGIKTDPLTKYVLATIFFTAKNSGPVTFHLDPNSSIFKNSDNSIIDTRVNDSSFDVEASPQLSPSPTLKPALTKPSKVPPSLVLLAPIGGEMISYNEPMNIKWSSSGLEQISISLLLNNQILGNIASGSASLGQISLKPSDFVLPTFLTPNNTFKIKITGTNSQKITLTDQSRGPFVFGSNGSFPLEASQAAILASRGGDANGDGTIDLFDVSKLLSSYGPATDSNFGVDLNGDQAVNDVDFYLLRNLMLQRELIQ